MPHIEYGNSAKNTSLTELTGRYQYEYPEGLNLDVGTELHDRIVKEVMERAYASETVMSTRHTAWSEMDKVLSNYTTDRVYDENGQETKRVTKQTIVPVTYSIYESLLSTLVNTFLDDPIFKYKGTGPEDAVGAIKLEKVVDVQTLKYKAGIAISVMLSDSLRYGLGVVSASWKNTYGKKVVKNVEEELPEKANFRGYKRTERSLVEGKLFEGTVLYNIDPYLLLLDTSVPISRFQDSEFVGWVERSNYVTILKKESSGEGSIFNVRYTKEITGRSNIYPGSIPRNLKTGVDEDQITTKVKPLDVIWMYIEIIPKEWGLGESEYPEKWAFGVANDRVLIKASRMELPHELFPVVVCAPTFDGHSVMPLSKLELTLGLQNMIDFMLSSHKANVETAVNNMFVVDPSRINMKDMKRPGPGKLIRLRQSRWGMGTEGAVTQLKTTDITANHLRDLSVLTEIMYGSSGATEAIRGAMRKTGERVSAAEATNVHSGTLSRVDLSVKMASMMAMQDLAYIFAMNTQYFMSQKTYVDLLGRWGKDLEKEYNSSPKSGDQRLEVEPDDLVINFDIIGHDGTLIGKEFAQSWIQIFQIISGNPELMAQMDMGRVLKHIGRLLGAKNIADFMRDEPLATKTDMDGVADQINEVRKAGPTSG